MKAFGVSSFKSADLELHYIHTRITPCLMFYFGCGWLPCFAELEDNSQISPGKQRCHGNFIVSLLCKGCLERMVESKLNRTAARNRQLEPVVLLQMHFFAPVHASV